MFSIPFKRNPKLRKINMLIEGFSWQVGFEKGVYFFVRYQHTTSRFCDITSCLTNTSPTFHQHFTNISYYQKSFHDILCWSCCRSKLIQIRTLFWLLTSFPSAKIKVRNMYNILFPFLINYKYSYYTTWTTITFHC